MDDIVNEKRENMTPVSWPERKKRAKRLKTNIKKVCKQENCSIADLAEYLGWNYKTFAKWGGGHTSPRYDEDYQKVRRQLLDMLKTAPTVPTPNLTPNPEPAPVQEPTPEPSPVVNAVTPDPLSVQVGGRHYKDMAIQPAAYITANELGYLEGCIVKRISRYDKPTGKGREDLEKVIHEAQILIALKYNG